MRRKPRQRHKQSQSNSLQFRDYNNDIQIDRENLEKEWMEHPSIYLYYAEAHADAVYEKELSGDELDLVFSELDAQIRKDWDLHFEKAPSEGAIKNWVIRQVKYKKALAKFQKAGHTANRLAAAKSSFEHKKKALENLVSLYVMGYGSEPKINKNAIRRAHTGLKK